MDISFLQGAFAGGGTSLLGLVGLLLATRQKREAAANALYEKIMAEVRSDRDTLKLEVELCKKRDARVHAIELCLRLAVPEVIRLDPSSATLRHVSAMLSAIPVDADLTDFAELIDELNDIKMGENGHGEH